MRWYYCQWATDSVADLHSWLVASMPQYSLEAVRERGQFLGGVIVTWEIGLGALSIIGGKSIRGSPPYCSRIGTTF
ncbi:MAG: hypothetical protein ABSD58_05485 [Verrucomicrobiia bacterium]|jgi:hypothetical protein